METVTTLEQLKPTMQIGDYDQVAKMVGTTRDGAKMRLRRNNPEAIQALIYWLKGRNKIIEDFQKMKTH